MTGSGARLWRRSWSVAVGCGLPLGAGRSSVYSSPHRVTTATARLTPGGVESGAAAFFAVPQIRPGPTRPTLTLTPPQNRTGRVI